MHECFIMNCAVLKYCIVNFLCVSIGQINRNKCGWLVDEDCISKSSWSISKGVYAQVDHHICSAINFAFEIKHKYGQNYSFRTLVSNIYLTCDSFFTFITNIESTEYWPTMLTIRDPFPSTDRIKRYEICHMYSSIKYYKMGACKVYRYIQYYKSLL